MPKPDSQTTNKNRIENLEKQIDQLQQAVNRLYKARILDHNLAIDQARDNHGSILDGLFF